MIAKIGDLLVWDNLSCHHALAVLKKLEEAGITVVFTPSKISWLISLLDNQIFANVKNRYRKWVDSRYGDFTQEEKQDAIFSIFESLRGSKELQSSFFKCGFPLYHLEVPQLQKGKLIREQLVNSQFVFSKQSIDLYRFNRIPILHHIWTRRLQALLIHTLYCSDIIIITQVVCILFKY